MGNKQSKKSIKISNRADITNLFDYIESNIKIFSRRFIELRDSFNVIIDKNKNNTIIIDNNIPYNLDNNLPIVIIVEKKNIPFNKITYPPYTPDHSLPLPITTLTDNMIEKYAIKDFENNNTYKFIIDGISYLICLHIDGPPDNHAIDKLDNFIKPTIVADKPEYSKNQQYLWGSTLLSKKSWFRWCLKELPDYAVGNCYYIIVKMENILDINNEEDFEEFEKNYKNEDNLINWDKVSNKYSGIAIMEYLSTKRENWYWSWDVDSIVIWNPNAIKKIIPANKSNIMQIFCNYDVNICNKLSSTNKLKIMT